MTIFEITILWITISPSYYWLMYAIAFILWYWIIRKRIYKNKKNILKPKTNWKIWDFMDSLLFYIFFWVVIWWRLWYVFFYNFSSFLENPLDILKVWEWGMSFHWWAIWVIVAMIFFSKKNKINFYKLIDQVALIIPIWLWLWRLGNYINKELLWFWDYNWFLAVKTSTWSYFPSSLIQLLLEGIILFIVLNLLFKYCKKIYLNPWRLASLFLILYWIFRIFVEIFFRQPDAHIWYIFNYFTLGQIYSLPMIVIWIYLYIKLWTQKK